MDSSWRECENQAGVLGHVQHGEMGGVFVVADEWPERRAYLKPRRRDTESMCERAAREKICSDLAHDLGFRVPPVVLVRRDEAPADEESACCMSLVMYPTQFSWEQVRSFAYAGPPATASLRDRLPDAASHGIAFDTWVGQRDHADHPHNIVFGYEAPAMSNGEISVGEYVFLDYAMALGFGGSWSSDGFNTPGYAPFPPAMVAQLDSSSLGRIIQKIKEMRDSTIAGIVNRIPDDYLPAQQRELIIRGLFARRDMLHELLAPLERNKP